MVKFFELFKFLTMKYHLCIVDASDNLLYEFRKYDTVSDVVVILSLPR